MTTHLPQSPDKHELLPCPFCTREAASQWSCEIHRIYCTNCGCGTRYIIYDNKHEKWNKKQIEDYNIKTWNTRGGKLNGS